MTAVRTARPASWTGARLRAAPGGALALVTVALFLAWPALARHVDHVLEVFGPDRLLFGSDWPVCLLAASYEQVIQAARETLGGLSRSESAAVFGGAAVATYGLAG